MPRTARAALSEHLRMMQIEASCVCRAVWRPGVPVQGQPGVTWLELTGPTGIAIGRPARVKLRASQLVATAPDQSDRAFDATVSGYRYELDGVDGSELIAFHWHPAGRSRITRPHIHLSMVRGADSRLLGAGHVPSGIVQFADVVRFIIVELGVQPTRADWRTILDT